MNYIKAIAGFIVIAIAFGAGVMVTKNHYLTIMAENTADYQKNLAKVTQAKLDQERAHQIDMTNAENQHAKDQLDINRLSHQLNRVRVHFPICPSPSGKTDSTGQDPDGTSRVLSNGVDEAFAEFQAKTSELIQRCDQLNIDARKLNQSLGN